MALLLRVLPLLCVLGVYEACLTTKKPSNPDPTEAFPRMARLDEEGDYYLYWTANATHAVFEVHVRTKGWVGFGLSKNGGMFPADIMIGWVKDGHATITDRFADAHYEPRLDISQNWILLLGKETEFGTILKFARKLDACDDKDFGIQGGTTKVIYAFHPEDPVRWTGLCYHGSRRGTKDLYLLDTKPIPKNAMPEDTQTYDILNENTLIPEKHTYYHCISFRMPDLNAKHHIVAFEPRIEHRDVVHHMVIYACPRDLGREAAGRQYECYFHVPSDASSLRECMSFLYAWAVGGDTLYLPEHIGIPLGDGYIPNFFVLETHYNNPQRLQGRKDNSGVRIHYTKTLRQQDASGMTVGTQVNPLALIPPHFPDYVQTGYCPASCTQEAYADLPGGEIKVVGVMLHTHLLGRGLILRHFRQGRELPPIAMDLHYDFDFQEFRLLNEEVVVKAGDVLTAECRYDSTRVQAITPSGLGTDEEMCLVFLFYYPRSSLFNCLSLAQVYEQYNITKGPRTLQETYQKLSGLDWTQASTRSFFQESVRDANQEFTCQHKDSTPQDRSRVWVDKAPVSAPPYSPPPRPTCGPK